MDEQLNGEYQIDEVHEKVSAELEQEIVDLLMAGGAFKGEPRAREQAKTTAFLARSSDGQVVAQVSVRNRHIKMLFNRFWVSSVYVAPEQRRSHLMIILHRQMRQFFEARFHEGKNPRTIGVYTVVETPLLRARMSRAVSEGGAVFVGLDGHGNHMRVYYFEGAHIVQRKVLEIEGSQD